MLCQILRGIHSVRIHAAPVVFAPARIQENIPGELFMYWFRARGYFGHTLKNIFLGVFSMGVLLPHAGLA